jgi:predicted metal-dependent phosphoesterase TrpH
MGLADLHIHTIYSLDGTATVRAVLKKAVEVGLDIIAITDHNQIRGSLEAVDLAPAYGISVIPGSEVTTADGHLLALFIQTNIPKGLSLEETVRRVADQGGLCIAPHPGGQKQNSLRTSIIRSALQDRNLAETLVGVEVFNAGMVQLGRNREARELAMEIPVAQVGNSDAHLLWMIGKGATAFDGTSELDLRRALVNRTTKPVMSKPDSRLMLVTHWLSRIALRYAGWVSINNNPQAPIQLARQA